MVESIFTRLGVPPVDEAKLLCLGKELFDVPLAVKAIADRIPWKSVYEGAVVLRLGKIPTPGLRLLEELGRTASKKAWVTPKGEWLFICGRNVLPGNITKTAGDPKPSDAVVVLNRHDECIGYGELQEKQLTRWFDIGDFLRRERKTKALAAKFRE